MAKTAPYTMTKKQRERALKHLNESVKKIMTKVRPDFNTIKRIGENYKSECEARHTYWYSKKKRAGFSMDKMTLIAEERSLLHFAVSKLLQDEEEMEVLSDYAKEQLLALQIKLIK